MKQRAMIVLGLIALVLAACGDPAGATTTGVCEPRAEQVQASTPEVPVTAPDGYLISGYCVKAGSIEQGLGPEEVTLPQPQASVVITHSSGKDVSHYVLRLIPVSTTTQPEQTTTAAGTTVVTTTLPATTTPVTTQPGVPETTVVPDPTMAPTTQPTPAAPTSLPSRLPSTGLEDPLTALLGLISLAVGAVLIRLTRR